LPADRRRPQNYQAFTDIPNRWPEIVATYIGVPVFLGLWLGYRIVRKTRLIDYEDMPFELPKRAITAGKVAAQA